jgi:hypothetical protein
VTLWGLLGVVLLCGRVLGLDGRWYGVMIAGESLLALVGGYSGYTGYSW